MTKHIVLPALAFIFFIGRPMAQEKIVSLPEVTVTSIALVAPNVNKAFKKAFPDAEDLNWYKYDKEYLAKFIIKDMNHNTLYRQNGIMKYDISYGYEHNLPEKIKNMVTEVYDNYKIIRAINIKVTARDIWVVKMEGMKKYLTVRVEDEEMDEVESFSKAETEN
ncbi:MAG: hypothetical protein ACK5GP_11760 [bacterium]|jgi:hypothetical protein